MKTSKLLITSLLAAAATMSVPAYADDVALTNGVQTALTISSGVAGAGNTYTYTAPEEGTTDNGGWLWLGDLQGTGNVALGSSESNMALSGSGLVVLGYQGGNFGTTYNFDFTNTDASAFSGKFAVVNAWNNSTIVKLSGTGWGNVEYVFAGVSREQNWVTKRMYNDTSRGYDTLALQGATTLAGITGTSKGYVPTGEGVAAGIGNVNLRESITVATSGTVLTLSGAGTYGFYGKVGTASARVGVSMTGTGYQTFGGTNYFDAVTVSSGGIYLDGTTDANSISVTGGSVALLGTMKVGAQSLVSVNGGSFWVNADSAIFDLSSSLLTASEGTANEITIVSGAEGASYVTGAALSDAAWGALSSKNFTVDGNALSGRSVVDVSSVGKVSITKVVANLVWAGTTAEGGNLWNTSTTNKPWTNAGTGDAFYAQDNVTFDSSAANKTVSIGGNLTVGTITVSADDYTFSATDNATITSGNITISAANGITLEAAQDKTLTFSGAFANNSNKVVEITKTGAGTAVVSNAANKIAKVTVSTGTLELYGETSDNTGKGVESFNVASGATLSIRSNDMARWSGSVASYDISGTLALNDKRVSIGGNNNGDLFKLNGGTITGTGEGGNGALDFFASRVINVSGESTISATIRVRDKVNGTADFNVAQESSLALSGELILASADKTIKKSGAGTLNFTSNTKSGNTAGTFEQAAGTTNITAGTKNLSTVKVTGGALNISGGTVSVTALNITGGAATISGGTTSTTNGTTVSNGGVLVLGASGAASYLRGVLTINDGGTVKLTGGDATGYGNTEGRDATNVIYKLVINKGGVLEIGTDATQNNQNQTFNMKDGVVLQGGQITAKSGVSNAKFDLFNTNTTTAGVTTLESDTTAVISADIGLRNKGSFDVAAGTTADGVDLLVSGRLTSRAQFTVGHIWDTTLTKSGAGTMKLTGDNQYWTTGGTIEAGTLIAAHENALGKLAAGKSLTVKDDARLQISTSIVNLGIAGAGVVLEQGAKLVIDLADFSLVSTVSSEESTEMKLLDVLISNTITFGDTTLTNGDTLSSELANEYILLQGAEQYLTTTWKYENDTLSLYATVPEPSAFGLLAGAGALALAAARRRRTKKA